MAKKGPESFTPKSREVLNGVRAYEQRRVDLATLRAVPASTTFYYSLGHPWKAKSEGQKNLQNWVKTQFCQIDPCLPPPPPTRGPCRRGRSEIPIFPVNCNCLLLF